MTGIRRLSAAALLLALALTGCGSQRPASALTGASTGPSAAPAPSLPAPSLPAPSPSTGHTPSPTGTHRTSGGGGSTARPGPTVKAYIDTLAIGGRPSPCPRDFTVDGTITSTRTLDLTYYVDVTVNNTAAEIKSAAQTVHVVAGKSQMVHYAFPTDLYATTDLQANIRITAPDVGASTNIVPLHTECGASLGVITTSAVPRCGSAYSVAANVIIPIGPHTQEVDFQYGNHKTTRTYDFTGTGYQSTVVSADLVIDTNPEAVSVSVPGDPHVFDATVICHP